MESMDLDVRHSASRIAVAGPGLLFVALSAVVGVLWLGLEAEEEVGAFRVFSGLALFMVAGLSVSAYQGLCLAGAHAKQVAADRRAILQLLGADRESRPVNPS